MEIKIKKPDLERITSEGIPKDFADVKNYFNEALERNSLPWIPRKNSITSEEIKNKWVPSLERNISLVAEHKGKIIGSATVFYDTGSTGYGHSNTRKRGEFNSTTNPDYNDCSKEITKKLIKETAEKLKEKNEKAHAYVSIESPNKKAFDELGYSGKEEFLPHYKTNDLSGKVMKYEFPNYP